MWGASARAHVHASFARWCLHARSSIADQGVILVLERPKNKSYFGAFPGLLPYQLPHFQLAHPAKQSLLLDGLVEATPCEGVLSMF